MPPLPTPSLTERTFNRYFLLVTSLLIVLLLIALIVMLRHEPDANRPWRIAITNWPGFDYLYLAEQKGFFHKNNLNIQLVPINTIIDMRTAFERGIIDGYTTPVMDTIESSQDTFTASRIVLITDISNGGNMILADPSITTVADLRGKRVGVEVTSSVSRFILNHALMDAGISPSEINIVPGSQTILTDNARRGNLDALVTYEPYATALLKNRPMHRLFDSSLIPNEIFDVLVVSPQVLEADPDFTHRIQLAWQNALDYARAHSEETKTILAARYQLLPEDYTPMLTDINPLTPTEMQLTTIKGTFLKSMDHVLDVLGISDLKTDDISKTISIWYQQESR